MNLLDTDFLQLKRIDGTDARLAIPSACRSDIVELTAPRPDFRAALYQLLIGLLQTTYAPEDDDEWLERWEHPPTETGLAAALAPWADAFVLDADGPAFMQDFDPLADAEPLGIANLLIDRGSDSNLFFNKTADGVGFCAPCTAAALMTLQINAPSGGRGYRVSLRGGGPLTCLLVPAASRGRAPSLWQRLWLNVLPQDQIAQPNSQYAGTARADILPWLAPARTSERKDGMTTPDHAHPLQAYWSMPRRIRLDGENTRAGHCDLCGAESDRLFTRFRTRNLGVQYLGWQHPLTPYYHDPKEKELPLSVKGQKGGIGYRHWVSLVLGNPDKQPEAARVVSHYLTEKRDRLGRDAGDPTLWASGFDMDNMKARCWYDASLPVQLPKGELPLTYSHRVKELLDVAVEASRLLPKYVKQSWANRPGELKDEPAIAQSFWQRTEARFYQMLDRLSAAHGLDPKPLAETQRDWVRHIRQSTLDLFDEWVVGEYAKDWDIERTVKARLELEKWLNAAKPMKALWKFINTQLKEPA